MKRIAQLLSCAFATSLLFTAVLVQLCHILNQEASWSTFKLFRLGWTIYWPYGCAPLLATILGFYLVQFLQGRSLRLWWLSVPVLTWSFAVVGSLTALLFLRNAVLYRAFLSPADSTGLIGALSCWALFTLTMVLVGTYDHFFPKARWRRVGIILPCAVLIVFSMPVGISHQQRRPPPRQSYMQAAEPAPTHGRLILIGLEGGSLNYILPLISQGRLPNFQTLLHHGAGGRMQTLIPAQSRPLWATVFTGKPPAVHGVTSEYWYHFPKADIAFSLLPRTLFFQSVLERTGALVVEAPPAFERGALCYWDFFKRDNGLSAGIVDLWSPVRRLHGFQSGNPLFPDTTPYLPPEMESRARAIAAESEVAAKSRVEKLLGGVSVPAEDQWKKELCIRAIWGDECARRIADCLNTDVTAVRLRGLDMTSHYFPASFAGDIYSPIDQSEMAFDRVVEQYYGFYDEIIGTYLSALPPDALLCVISVHGMDPLPAWRRLIEILQNRPPPVGGHERGPDGFIYFYGNCIAPGASVDQASVYSLLPTLLYYQGLPVGLDMEGDILLDVFSRAFKETHPASYIPTHEIAP